MPTFSGTMPIISPAILTPEQAFSAVTRYIGVESRRIGELVYAHYDVSTETGISPEMAIAQTLVETSDFGKIPGDDGRPAPGAIAWAMRNNTASMGITDNGEGTPVTDNMLSWTTVTLGVIGQQMHLLAYVDNDKFNKLPFSWQLQDQRYDDMPESYFNSATTWQDLSRKWAGVNDYGHRIANRANAVFGEIEAVSEKLAPKDVAILIVAGHRSHLDPGNPGEKSLTPALALDYRKAFLDAGFPVVYVQQADGDDDPDDTVGGLDNVGAITARRLSELVPRHRFVVMLDLHFEGAAPSASGVFAIYPRSNGLRSAIQGPHDNDAEGNNPLDKALAGAIARHIGQRTGLSVRQGLFGGPGVMGEQQTGVALSYGARLAMFAYTSPYQPKALRLVVEHGNLQSPQDRDRIFRDDFTQLAAAGAVAAVREVLGVGKAEPATPTPPSKWATPKPLIPAWDGTDRHNWRAVRRRVSIVNTTTPRQFGEDDAPPTGADIKKGATRLVDYVSTNGSWYMLPDGSRIRTRDASPRVTFES